MATTPPDRLDRQARPTPVAPRSGLLPVLLSTLLLALAGCRREPPPNVLLISLDALRADHLSAYGYRRDTSPFLAELAARGIRFANAFANTLGTTTSHTTMLSSLYQESHRVEWAQDGPGQPWDRLPVGAVMLQEILARRGYRTLAVTDGGRMHHKFGFDRGFDRFVDKGRGVRNGTLRLLELLDEEPASEAPLFVFYHTYEVHSPYRPPEAYRDRYGKYDSLIAPVNPTLIPLSNRAADLSRQDLEFLAAQYDAGIRFTDDTLRQLFAALATRGFLANTLIVLTADHGEEFGEHGGLLHRGLLYDELLHVPLILVGPGLSAGTVDRRLAGLVDVAPTVLGYLGLPVPDAMEGRNLLGPPPPEADDALFAQFRRQRYAIRTRRWKLILDREREPPVELYDLAADPAERTDVAPLHPDVVRALRARLLRWRAARVPVAGTGGADIEPDAEQRRRLEALGYVDG